MLSFISPGLFLLIALLFLVFSKSKKYYQKVLDSHGEKFANQTVKVLEICGYGLIVCVLFWSIIIILK
jgi:ABC-type nickel/cobalt efflux system permease component RcnA